MIWLGLSRTSGLQAWLVLVVVLLLDGGLA